MLPCGTRMSVVQGVSSCHSISGSSGPNPSKKPVSAASSIATAVRLELQRWVGTTQILSFLQRRSAWEVVLRWCNGHVAENKVTKCD